MGRASALSSFPGRQVAGNIDAAAKTRRPDVPLHDVVAASSTARNIDAAAKTRRPDVPLHDVVAFTSTALDDNRSGRVAQEVYAASPDDDNDLEEAPDEIRRAKRPPVAAVYSGSNVMRTKAQAPSVTDDDTNREAKFWFQIKVGCGLAALVLILGLSLGLSLSETDPGDCPAGFSRLRIDSDKYNTICGLNGELYDFCCRDDPTDPVRWRVSLAPLIDYDVSCPAGYSQLYAGSCASTCGCSQPDASDKTSLKCDMCCKNDDGKCAHHDPDCPAGFSRMRINNAKYDDICGWNGELYDFCCRDDPTDPVRWRLSLTPVIDYDAACPAGYSQFYAGSCASACGCRQPDASDETSLKCDMCCNNDDGECAHHDPDCPAGFSRMRIDSDKYNTICGWNGDRYDFCCRDNWRDPVRWRLSKDPGIDYTEGCKDGYSRIYYFPCNHFCRCPTPDADYSDSLKCSYCCTLTEEGTCGRMSPSTA